MIEILERQKNLIVQSVEGRGLWATWGYEVFKSEDGGRTWEKKGYVYPGKIREISGKSRFMSRIFRLGVQNLFLLRTGALLAFADRKVYRSEDGVEFVKVFDIENGRTPLPSGITEDGGGNVFFGEYFNNPHRKAVNIMKSSDDGRTWEKFFVFPEGSIRHVHAVQYDEYSDRIWVATGDEDRECIIGYLERGKLHPLAEGEQRYRAVSLLFTDRYIYWGTDSPDKKNFIYRMGRNNGNIERLKEVDGPIYYTAKIGNILIAASTVEKGQGLKDNYTRIWESLDGSRWEEAVKWKKDRLPYILGYGVVRFPVVMRENEDLYFSTLCLKGADGKMFKASISEEAHS